MPCPICTGTMQNLGVEGQRIFWCPRCGTVKTERAGMEEYQPPKLVKYIYNAEETAIASVDGRTLQYAVPSWCWVAACEAVGRQPVGT